MNIYRSVLLACCFGLVCLPCLVAAGVDAGQFVLIEAEGFDDIGGWVVDPQFMDQMGSPFLLAHGLGEPVGDAVTTVGFSETGTYRVWVRTRDWVGPWKKADTPKAKRAEGCPGRFKVLVDGKALDTTFGTRSAEWFWHDGGTVKIKNKKVKLALHDLTGFEGRCDAVLFCKDSKFVPPHKLDELTSFRREILGTDKVIDSGEYDLVVVGGGIAGTCAAVSGARSGLKVALVQDRPVVGGNNSSEVRVWLQGARSKEPWRRVGDVVAELEQKKIAHYGPSNTADLYEDDKKLAVVRGEKNITLLLNYRGNGVEMDGKSIRALIAQDIRTGKRIRLKARLFADCTGDACIGALAGADFDIQMKDKMGPCNLWNVCECKDTDAINSDTKKTTEVVEFPRCPWALDLSDKPFPGRSKTKPNPNNLGGWYWESGFDRDPIKDMEYVRDWNFRAMYGAWDAMKNVDKVLPNHKLNWSAHILGKRESRRLMGDVVLTVKYLMDDRKFVDGCYPTGWSNDLHLPNKKYDRGFEGDAFISRAIHGVYPAYKENLPYWVPYRCLYSRNIENLFMAGRCVSVTHDALGAVRVMRTGGCGGEIVGMAAAVCKQFDTNPRGVYKDHLADLQSRMRNGVGKVDGSTVYYKNQGERGHTIRQALAQPEWLNRAGKNLARRAIVSTNVSAVVDGVKRSVLINDGNGKVTSNSGLWVGRGKMPHVIEFKWEKPVQVGAARIITGRTNGVRVFAPIIAFKLQHFDGESWHDVFEPVRANKSPAWSARFESVKTKHLRMVITRTPHNISRVWEVEFYGPLEK